MRRRCVLLVSCLGALALGVPASSEACSTLPPGLLSRSVVPVSGASNLPRNVRIWIRYAAIPATATDLPALGPDLVLRVQGGALVPTRFEPLPDASGPQGTIVLIPEQALPANTTYEVSDRRRVPCQVQLMECGLGEPAVFATFTTGDFLDTTAPVFAGIASLDEPPFNTCPDSRCCGPYVNRGYTLRWDSVQGQGDGWLFYNVYRRTDAGLQNVAVTEHGAASLLFTCEGPSPSRHQPGEFLVRAVDWAGNEDGNLVSREIRTPCAGAPPAVPAATSSGGTDGCAMARGAFSAAPALVALVLLGLGAIIAFRNRHHGRNALEIPMWRKRKRRVREETRDDVP